MKPPGFFAASARLAAKDLRIEWRTWETVVATAVFSAIVIVILDFSFDLATAEALGAERVAPGTVWTVLAFGVVVGTVRSFQLERRRDSLAAVYLAPIDRGAIFAGKALANLVKLVALEVIVLALASLAFALDPRSALAPLAGVLLLHGLGLAALGTLFAGVATKLGRGEALLATLLFPAAAPLLISGVECTAAALGPGLGAVRHWLLLALGFDLLYVFVGLMTFEFVLEE